MLVDINLLPNREKKRPLFTVTLVIFALIFILFTTALLVMYMSLKADVESAEQEYHRLVIERADLEEEVGIVQGEEIGIRLREAIDYTEGLQVPTTIFISDLNMRLPSHGYLSSYNYQNRQTGIQVQFETLEDVAAYVTELERSAFVADVQINSVHTFEHEGETNQFKVIPRYDVSLSLQADPLELRKEERSRHGMAH
ncbi:PilN domain-containing protein [Desertibacillus haloalkaliphilus]|uniref:PilN domain-containing protein n=1 Tax=Desertibacillus haloalkaliphilus TaxID=1328930 RepID=UPI001C269FA3|nr:PilN domain-containing protein [Desertibacillus haloalkaliphilus]MBU8905045.1 hypothetical protein [Desertibacillus haloalkaliphilus]